MKSELKERLEYHYRKFDRTTISPDPLEFPHQYKLESDIEISAFVSSIFAYGNVAQIIKILTIVHNQIGNSPTKFIERYSMKKGQQIFKNCKYRFYTTNDIVILFEIIKIVINKFGSLQNLFISDYCKDDSSILNSLDSFSNNLLIIASEINSVTNGIKFMFPKPSNGSTCKRMNLFLRWVVRNDELDFGIWTKISTSQLIIPVDTHIAKICKELKLTTLKNPSWKMAEQITKHLKKFDKTDPVKYDFALCHIGMRKLQF